MSATRHPARHRAVQPVGNGAEAPSSNERNTCSSTAQRPAGAILCHGTVHMRGPGLSADVTTARQADDRPSPRPDLLWRRPPQNALFARGMIWQP